MLQEDAHQALASRIERMFTHAAAELAERVGSAGQVAVTPAGAMPPADWASRWDGPCLLVRGSVAGKAEGPVVFVLQRADAVRLAAMAEEGGQDNLEERLAQPLTEADTAAVVFAMARVGAGAAAVWPADEAHWPSDAAELEPGLADFTKDAEALAASLGGAAAAIGTQVRLGGTPAIEITVLVPETLAARLARSAEAQGASPDVVARILPVAVPLRAVVAQRRVRLGELLELIPGQVLDLQKLAIEPLELRAGSKTVALGEAVVADNRLAFRVAQLVGVAPQHHTDPATPA